MMDRCARWGRRVVLIALAGLGLGCGGGVDVVHVTGDAAKQYLPSEFSGGGAAKKVVENTGTLGLMDPSTREGDEISGPMTYAYRPAPEGSTPKRGGEVVVGFRGDIDSFNPFLSSSAAASEVADLIFPRLMSEQPDYYDGVPTFNPQIAETWTIAPDNRSIRFTLREAVWHDGTPISSDDVRFSWEAAKSPDVAWVSASIVDFIRDIEIHSPREFTVHYTKSTPYNIMDINDVQIIPKHTFGQVPFDKWSGYPDWAKLATSACAGPWILDEHREGEFIKLKRNERYWDEGKPYLDSLKIKIFQDTGAIRTALIAGQVDVKNGIEPDKAKFILSEESLLLYSYVARSYGYLGWNCLRFPFDDSRVRRAMTMAIDRANLVESAYEGYAEVASPYIIRSMWASQRDQVPLPFDPDGAERLLQAAGWKKGEDGIYAKDGRPFRFEMLIPAGSDLRKRMSVAIQSDLKRIGVDVQLRAQDGNRMSGLLKEHNFEAYMYGWYIATKIDPKPMFHSTSVKGRYNYVNYMNPTIDALIDRGRVMNVSDPKVREDAMAVWAAYQAIMRNDQPYTMLYEPRGLVGINKKFVNVRVTSLRFLDNVHEWWIDEDAR